MKFVRQSLAVLCVIASALVPNLAFASQTALTVHPLKVNNYAVQAGDLTVAFTACDPSNGNSFAATGTEIILVQNTDSATHTFTVNSVADGLGRTDSSLTGYSVLVSPGIVAIQMKNLAGWAGTGQVITLACSSNLLNFSILRTN
jgi:hypothetical protein